MDGDNIDSALVEVHGLKGEIEKRVQAFADAKKLESQESNGAEFCLPGSECARVDAAPLKRLVDPDTGARSSGHIRVIRVDNSLDTQLPHAVEERFANIEAHLEMERGRVTKEVLQRLKAIEARILELEKARPTYFAERILALQEAQKEPDGDAGSYAPKMSAKRKSEDPSEMSEEDIDARIKRLRDALNEKKRLKNGK